MTNKEIKLEIARTLKGIFGYAPAQAEIDVHLCSTQGDEIEYALFTVGGIAEYTLVWGGDEEGYVVKFLNPSKNLDAII